MKPKHVHRWGKWIHGSDYGYSRYCDICGKWEDAGERQILAALNHRPVKYVRVGEARDIIDIPSDIVSRDTPLYIRERRKR